LVNIDPKKSHSLQLNLKNMEATDFLATILTSAKLQDHNSFEENEKIKPNDFKNFKLKKGILNLEIPPFSIITFQSK
jgi:alpha-N-arabinofuranosidase